MLTQLFCLQIVISEMPMYMTEHINSIYYNNLNAQMVLFNTSSTLNQCKAS